MIDRVARPMTAGRLVDGEEAMSVGTTSPTRDPRGRGQPAPPRTAGHIRPDLPHAQSERVGPRHPRTAAHHARPDPSPAERLHRVPHPGIAHRHRTVAHAHLIGSAPSYYLTDRTEHAHLVCQDCGTTTPLRGRALQRFVAELATDPGFTVTISHLTVQGHCQPCQTQRDGSPVQRDSAPANEQQQWQCPPSAATLPAQGQVPARR